MRANCEHSSGELGWRLQAKHPLATKRANASSTFRRKASARIARARVAAAARMAAVSITPGNANADGAVPAPSEAALHTASSATTNCDGAVPAPSPTLSGGKSLLTMVSGKSRNCLKIYSKLSCGIVSSEKNI